MFRRNIHMEMGAIRTTSKVALKLSCLECCGNDIDKAERLYRFISEGLELPDADPEARTGLERFRSGADEVLGWLGGHRDEIQQGVALFQALKGRAMESVGAIANLPEIPKP